MFILKMFDREFSLVTDKQKATLVVTSQRWLAMQPWDQSEVRSHLCYFEAHHSRCVTMGPWLNPATLFVISLFLFLDLRPDQIQSVDATKVGQSCSQLHSFCFSLLFMYG